MATSATSVAELTARVEQLKEEGNWRLARQEIEKFINDHPAEAEEHDLNDLLASLITTAQGTSQPEDDEPGRRLRSARVYAETGDKNTALGILKNMLQDWPENRQVLEELTKLADTYPDYREDVSRFLESMPANEAIEDALVRLRSSRTAEAETPPETPVSSSSRNKLAEAMKLYRTRHHQEAMELFDELIRTEPEGGTIWKEAREYRQRAEEAFLRGEVPLEELPEEALVNASKARSFVRLGDYEQAERLYSTAIDLARQAGKAVPGDWMRQREEAEVYAGARRLEKEGDAYLKDDEWDLALERWAQAYQAMDEQDPRLQDKIESLKGVRENVVRADFATTLGPGDIETQANDLAQAIVSLRDAAIKFPGSRRISELRDRVLQSASEVVDSVRERGAESNEKAENARTLQAKRNWVEQAQKWYELAARLSPGQSALGLEAMAARGAANLYHELQQDLQRAEKLIVEGPEESLQEAQQLVERVKGHCPSDPDLILQLRRLERRYVDLAEQYLASDNLVAAEEYIGMLQGDLFRPLSPGAKLTIGRVERAVARRNLLNKVKAAGIGGGIVLGVLIIAAVLYRPVVVPMLAPDPTPTPTAQATPLPSPTPTVTVTPSPTATETPAPTATPTPIPAYARVQAYTYPLPCGRGGHSGFVYQFQRVGVVREEVCADGERWLYIVWTMGDAQQNGWIRADNVGF